MGNTLERLGLNPGEYTNSMGEFAPTVVKQVLRSRCLGIDDEAALSKSWMASNIMY